MPRSRRKKYEKSEAGSPLWMTSFADMVTLLLSFFILLYAFSEINILKWQQAVVSLNSSLGVLEGGKTLNKNELIQDGQPGSDSAGKFVSQDMIYSIEQMQAEIQKMLKLQEHLKNKLQDKNILVKTDQRGVVIRFQDSVLFDKGKAVLKPSAKKVLTKVSSSLNEFDNQIRIEGHTDNIPINTVKFPSNWELSAIRATNVLKYLVNELKVKQPARFSAVGYGEFHPLVSNNNEENRVKNRRVDIVILRDSLRMQEPSKENNISLEEILQSYK